MTRRAVNLASRSLGASVLTASDESFGEKENLIADAAADFTPGSFGHKGEIVDGWETRRRGGPGNDWVLIRLGSPGVISSVDVDTSFFTGNYPESCYIEACGLEGYPSPEELQSPDVAWEQIVPASPLKGDSHNTFPVTSPTRFTHVRLTMEPDGGIARLRVNGHVRLDPAEIDGLTVDLAARHLGGVVEFSSDDFYSHADSINLPDLARNMGEGWETKRRRGAGNDWAVVRLAAPARLRMIEVDTSYYKYNASKYFALHAATGPDAPQADAAQWRELLPRTRLQPDTRHRFLVTSGDDITHVRLDVFPDGGISRLRIHGQVVGAARREVTLDWLNSLPRQQAVEAVQRRWDAPADLAGSIADRRPIRGDTHPDGPVGDILRTILEGAAHPS